MSQPRSTAIYARISKDLTGERLGVERQLEDCRALARELGWPVGDEYVDNDKSAYSGKARPEYRRMLDDLRSGARDGVIAWHADRLHRSPAELEEFIIVADSAGAEIRTVRSGRLELDNATGRMTARIVGAVARSESERMSERMKRGNRQRAEQGRPNTRGRRKFGYEKDAVTIREDEAAIIRELAERFLAGESLVSLVRWLNDNEIPTATGHGTWWSAGLRKLLHSARISGQREYHGEIVAAGQWPAIITPEQTTRIRRILDDPARRTLRTPSRYLLTGLLTCARCKRPLISHPKSGVPAYDCRRDVGRDACGKLSIVAEPLDELIRDMVLDALDGPELARAMLTRSDPNTTAENLASQIRADEDKLTQLAEAFADDVLTPAQLKAATTKLRRRIAAARDQLATLDGRRELGRYLGHGNELRTRWQTVNLDQRRAVIRSVVDAVIIHPAKPGGGRFDPDRAEIRWKI